jgi:hypothetical protein
MWQALVGKVRAEIGDEGGDDAFVRAELARAYEDLRYPSSRLRPVASIVSRADFGAEVDETELVRLAAHRVMALGGTPRELTPDRPSEDLRMGVATRAYDGFSFGSRYELPRENPPLENRVAR